MTLSDSNPRKRQVADFLLFAKFMNGTCPKCGRINAHDGTPRCDCEKKQ
jgi:hypothetical protein